MKKIFGALMIAVCIGMAMPAQAQIHFGVNIHEQEPRADIELYRSFFENTLALSEQCTRKWREDEDRNFYLVLLITLFQKTYCHEKQRPLKLKKIRDDIGRIFPYWAQ